MTDLTNHTAQLMDHVSTEWMLQFTLPTDENVFPDHGEQVIYTSSPEAGIVHAVRFYKSDAAKRGYHRVLSLGATEVRFARRLVAHSDWDDVTP